MASFSKDDVKKVYGDAKELSREKYFLTENMSEYVLNLREGIAKDEEHLKKDGTPNVAKVNAGLVKKAVEVILHDKNKLKEDLKRQDEIEKAIRKNPMLLKIVNQGINTTEDDLLDNKERLATVTSESVLDDDITSTLVKIGQEEVKEEEATGDKTVTKTTDPDSLKSFADLIRELREIINS